VRAVAVSSVGSPVPVMALMRGNVVDETVAVVVAAVDALFRPSASVPLLAGIRPEIRREILVREAHAGVDVATMMFGAACCTSQPCGRVNVGAGRAAVLADVVEIQRSRL